MQRHNPRNARPTLLVIGIFVLSSAARSQTALIFSSPEYRADDYYQARRDLNNVRKAISILQSAVSSNPRDYEAWWRISEYNCYLARHVPQKEMKPILRAGIAAGKKAEALRARRPEGHFWTGANEGLLGENSNIITGLRLIDPVRNEMETVMKLDPAYQEYGAERILGRLYEQAPFFRGGDKQLSLRLLQDCLKRYPNNSLTLLYLADTYMDTGRREDARKMLERILTLCPDPIYGPELADNQTAAKEKLAKYFYIRK